MKINQLQFVTGAIVLLACLFIAGVLFNLELLSNYSRALIFPFFVYLYFIEANTKNKFFAIFLFSYALAEVSNALVTHSPELLMNICNMFYILSYLSLLAHIAESINLKRLVAKFRTYLIVLGIFNAYIIFILNQMIIADESLQVFTFNFFLECAYNISILLVLSFALINYIYHDSKRGLLLFLASVCIVFSEMVQVAYIYVAADYILNVTYSLLMGIGFYFVYVYIVSRVNKYYQLLS